MSLDLILLIIFLEIFTKSFGILSLRSVVSGMMMKEDLMHKLDKLTDEHRTLEDKILNLMSTTLYDQVNVQRLKKRKLQIKDEITKLKTRLIPDIIA